MPQTLTPTGAPSIFGGVGRLEWSSGTPDDPFPVWQDITTFVRTEETQLRITRGRQNELDQIRPSQLTCDLDNTDSRFTFGYTAGPYGSTWTPAKQVRYSETIGLRTFVLYRGWIEYPDISDWQPIGYQTVQLTCTDRLTRLSRGRPFYSALAEYIVFNGGTDLKGYWPMTDVAEPFAGFGPTTSALIMVQGKTGTTGLSTKPQPNTGLAPEGGEALGARMAVLGNGTAGHVFTETVVPSGFAPAIGANDAVVVVFWFAFTANQASNDSGSQELLLCGTPSIPNVRLQRNTTTGVVNLDCAGGAMTGSTAGASIGVAPALLPIGVYVKESTAKIEFWVGGQRISGTLAGAPVGAGTLTWSYVGYGIDYDLSHLQIYVGNSFTYTNYLAQINHGYAPLDQQTTGQRINTLLDYAGIASTDRLIDPGQTVMPAAQIAGQDPGAALANVVNAERGRGFAAAHGPYVFHDRVRTLNV